MRIVQLVENLELGGLERMAVDLAIAEKRSGHEVLVYCLHGSGSLAEALEEPGIPVVTFNKKPGFSFGCVLAMAHRLRSDRVDVIHGHNPGVHHYGALGARLAGVPACINTRHSVINSQGLPYQERYFRWVQPLTGHVAFVCDFVRRGLEPAIGYPPEKCSVIGNGIPLDRFLEQTARPGARRPRFRFGTIGRLVPAKGHSVMVDAFVTVVQQEPGAELSIFGYGVLEGELRSQIDRLGLDGKVRLEGATTNSAATLQELDVFVFSSVTEGLPLVILEAMAAGLPVVSTDVGGIPEVIPKECGWLCPPGNAKALADVMLAAMRTGNLAERGKESRRVALESFGLQHMASKYAEVYRNLLRSSGNNAAG